MQVVDFRGQSGTAYRFRRVQEIHELPVHSGNFIVTNDSERAVLACGTRRSLAQLADEWERLVGDDATLLVRLNVASATRLAEHEDLVAALKPLKALRETD